MDELRIEISEFLKNNSAGQLQRNNGLNQKFAQYYKLIFDKEFCTGCPNKFNEPYYELLNYSKFKNNQMSESKFKMKPGVSACIKRVNKEPVTNANLTDEIAVGLLAHNKAFAKKFVTMPEGWEKSVEAYKTAHKMNPVKRVKKAAKVETPVTPVAKAKEVKAIAPEAKKMSDKSSEESK